MSKSFNFTQAKGKWHKFSSFNLGRGAKLHKNFAQKLLAVSLCMAMVLLGVPRGQNFVAAAADEATKSVALLTLTLTGDEKEPLTAKMEWKSFVQGTTVGLEVIFVDEKGNASEPLDYGSWLDTYGSLSFSAAGFATFAPGPWLEALPSSSKLGMLFGAGWEPELRAPLLPWLGARDWFAPLPYLYLSGAGDPTDYFGFVGSPGLARVPLGSSLSVLPHPFFHSVSFGVGGADLDDGEALSASFAGVVADPSVVSFDSASASIVGVGEGVTTLSLSATLTFTAPDGKSTILGPVALGTLAVEVYDLSPVTGVTLSETTKSLAVGESFDLTATISPADATNTSVTWTSNDASIATVSGDGLTGSVTALKAGKATITVTTEDGDHKATCEVTVTEASAGPAYLEAAVDVKGQQQRLRVYDPNGLLPEGATSSAEAVTEHEHLDDDHEIEHLLSYNISLLDANGDSLPMPLSNTVELCFEVLDGLDKNELEVVLVQEFDDAEFEENLVDLDGASWVKVKTNHFSPHVLLDTLSPEEKAALDRGNIQTGDLAIQITVAGLGMTLVLALGVMLRLITSKRKFDE